MPVGNGHPLLAVMMERVTNFDLSWEWSGNEVKRVGQIVLLQRTCRMEDEDGRLR